MVKTRAKKYRGHREHGRGKKAGRGKGLRGGTGNAGLHKHKFTLTILKEKQGIRMFGRYGFKRPPGQVFADATLNVGELATKFAGQSSVDLAEHGYTKLLGAGQVPSKVDVKVEAASAKAVEKIQAAGGSVTTTRKKKEPKSKKAPQPKGGKA